jgi:hypothetical protein
MRSRGVTGGAGLTAVERPVVLSMASAPSFRGRRESFFLESGLAGDPEEHH